MTAQRGLVPNRESVPSNDGTPANDNAPNRALPGRLLSTRADMLIPKPVDWLWPSRIPLGEITFFGGEPAACKSQVIADITARVTTGREYPANEGIAPLGSVLLFSPEDDPRTTVRPRLEAAGADLTRVHVVEAADFNLMNDLDLLESRILEVGDMRLVTFDPISSFAGGHDNSNARMREMLIPLANLARRHCLAVVCVTHFSKSGGRKVSLQSLIGSIANGAVARSAIAFVNDPVGGRYMNSIKSSLGADAPPISFEIEEVSIAVDWGQSEIPTSRVVWGETQSGQSVSATEVDDEQPSLADDACQFLDALLLPGTSLPVKEIEALAVEAGRLPAGKAIDQSKPFRTARKRLGLQSRRITEAGGTGRGYSLWVRPT